MKCHSGAGQLCACLPACKRSCLALFLEEARGRRNFARAAHCRFQLSLPLKFTGRLPSSKSAYTCIYSIPAPAARQDGALAGEAFGLTEPQVPPALGSD